MLVATVLTLLSVNTLHLLARVGLEKSFFVPVIVSAVFFWYGSLVNVVFNVCLQSMPILIAAQDAINFLHQITLLIGLSILTYGVFSYWRITRHVKLPKHERLEKQADQRDAMKEISPAGQMDQKVGETEPETANAQTNDQVLQPEPGVEQLAPKPIITQQTEEEDQKHG